MARFKDEIYEIKEKELILNYQRYEYTSNMIYEFFKRTLRYGQKIEDFTYKPIIEHTSKIKDVILYENSEIKFTLQDVIYNACPKLYEELIQDDKIKDKINFSMDITEFLITVKKVEDTIVEIDKKRKKEKITPEEEKSYNECKNFFNTVIYKDLIQNKYIQLTKNEILKKIDETLLYKKMNVRYTKKQLNIEECNFINIYDLNINLPDEELLDYLLMLKAKQKKVNTKQSIKEFDKLSNEEKSKIRRYITFKNKKLFTKKNQQRKLEFTREPVILFNEFLETDKIKKINESRIEEENLEKIYQEYKDLEQENLERIQKENKKKNLEYKSYIYDPQKLAHILFVYDHMQIKIENFTSDQLMKRIQCSILYHRREFINMLETEDLEDECGLSENDSNKVINLKNELYDLLKFNPSLEEEFDKDTLILIDEENIKEIDKLMKKIYALMNENCRKRFLPYLPFISSRTLYKYYEIAKFYIDEKGYKLLLD